MDSHSEFDSIESQAILLPCPNKFCRKVMDHNGTGVIVYGSRTHIYFVNIRVLPPTILDDKVIRNAHKSQVVSVSFCKTNNSELLASIGDDSTLKVWELNSCQNVAEIKLPEFCQVIEWLAGSLNTLTFPAEKGGIAKWNFKENCLRKLDTKCRNAVVTLVSNAKCPHLLAAGHCNGTITVMNIVKETILHSFGSHDKEILSLSWSPVSPDILLSASEDQTLRLWKVGEDWPLFTYSQSSQNRYGEKKRKFEEKKKQKYFGICHPDDPDAIIISSLRGEIGSVSWKEKAEFIPYHSKDGYLAGYTFAMLVLSMEYQEKKKMILFCFDSFKISLWDIAERKSLCSIRFLLGEVLDLKAATVNPNLLAMCTSDGWLKVWHLTSQTSTLDLTSIYVYVKARIMTASWHPVEENIVAYGTNEGRVGIVDLFKKKSMYCFETHHKGAVYSLTWGPCLKFSKLKDSDTSKYVLYSCGAGTIYINKLNEAQERALNFGDLVDKLPDMEESVITYSEVCWKSDYTYLAVGSQKGSIYLYNVEAVLIIHITMKLKSIESLQWHPDYTYASPDGSPLKLWLASAGTDHDIHLFDIREMCGKDRVQKVDRSTKKLAGHTKNICSLSWSPHSDGFLASASKDGTVQVWNVLSGSPVANYQGHKDLVFAVHWSPLDPDVIFSGGQDGSVRLWKISQQIDTAPPVKCLVKRTHKVRSRYREESKGKPLLLENGDISDSVEIGAEKFSMATLQSDKKPNHNVRANSSKNEVCAEKDNVTEECKRKLKNSVTTNASLFAGATSVTSKNNIKNCQKLADIICNNSLNGSKLSLDLITRSMDSAVENDIMNLGLFIDQLSALKMIELQSEKLESLPLKGSASYVPTLGKMMCNTKEMLEKAAEKGELSEFLISLAPLVSYSFWHEMCYKYANQLSGRGQYLQATIYLIACGKLYEALDLLAEKENVVNALAVAKALLPESDPIIKTLLMKCARKFRLQQLHALEAQCFMAAKEYRQAALVLYSTLEPSYIRTAAYVCKKFGDDKEAAEYCFLCLERCLINHDWSSFKKLIEQEPSMQVYSAVVFVHENLCNHLKQMDFGDLQKSPSNSNGCRGMKFWEGITSLDSQKSFIEYIYENLIKEDILPPKGLSLQDLHQALLHMSKKRKNSEIPSEAHISVAIYVTQYIILSLLGDLNSAEQYFIRIFQTSCIVPSLLSGVCSLFLPFDLFWCSDTNTILCEGKYLDDVEEDFILKYKSLCDSFKNAMSEQKNCFDEFIINNLTDLSDVIQYTKTLPSKQIGDILLPYLAVNLIETLSKLVSKMDSKFKHHEIDSQGESCSSILLQNDLPAEGENACKESNIMNIENIDYCSILDSVVDSENVAFAKGVNEAELLKVINIVLKEADEKADLLRKAQDRDCKLELNNVGLNGLSQSEQSNADFTDTSDSSAKPFLIYNENIVKKENNLFSNQSKAENSSSVPRKTSIESETVMNNKSSAESTVMKEKYEIESLNIVSSIQMESKNKNEWQTEATASKDNFSKKEIEAELNEPKLKALLDIVQLTSESTKLVVGDKSSSLQESSPNLNEMPQEVLNLDSSTNTSFFASDSFLNKGENAENDLKDIHANAVNFANSMSTEIYLKDIDFFNLLKHITSFICKDEHAVLYYVKERSASYLSAANSKESFVQSRSTDEDSLLNNGDTSKDCYAEVFDLLIEKSKGIICPDPFAVVEKVIKMCCDMMQKIQYENLKVEVHTFIQELKLWKEKFCA